ncbi:hypothetical protein PVL29_020531 [Vitis rotundifolia]|uniref:Uncharacterized protein n=1 Tax=Vitis rotundifolia TaxID=103349 RepID=A0AA39DDM3_VITRO|nr:hypothetical protein PVL29_020531 [Vitis rotundifolia]
MVSSAFFQIQPLRRSNQPNSPVSFFNGNIAQYCSLPKKNMIIASKLATSERAPSPPKLPNIGSDRDTTSAGLGKRTLELLESFLSFFSSSLLYFINPPLHPSVDPKHVLTGNFAPVDELPPIDCLVMEGELPQSLNGTYIRNGPNPLHQPRGPHHLFEGDGMLHSIRLSDSRATFCSRYVKTYKYAFEDNVGFPIFPNILSSFHSFGLANTSLSLFSNRLFALGESNLPYSIHLSEKGDIETIGQCETFAFRCSPISPYITFFSIDKEGSKQQDVPILSMTDPTFVHDFSITKQYIVFSESQIETNPLRLMMCKGMPVSAKLDKVPRIGVLPRCASTDSEIRWFKAPGFNTMHATNAWEEGDEEIILVPPNVMSIENLFHNIGKVHLSLEKVRINLRNGSVTRTTLSQKNLELGSINPSYMRKKNMYAYMGIEKIIPKMSGVVKIDLELECEVSRRLYGAGCFGREPLFVVKDGASEEDDGYIVSYVHDNKSGASRFVVMDAKSQTLDVVTAVKLPRRVPYGFHGLFVKDGDIREIY